MHIRTIVCRKVLLPVFSSLLIASFVPLPMASASALKQQTTGVTEAKEAEAFADQFFNQPQIKKQLAGAAVVLVKNNQVLLEKGYGYADISSKKPIDPEKTVFRVASISKLFTATAVMQLAEQGTIDLHADLQTYLGDLNIVNKTNKTLTMEHLLTHTSGFDYTDSAGGSAQEISNKQFIKENVPTIVREPGEAYRYDNYAFNLQGYIVERMTGVPFTQYVQEHIFKPLGMGSSSFKLTPGLRKALAVPYTAQKDPIPEYPSRPAESPDGGMFSTGRDMAQFMIAQLNGGQLAGARILSGDSVKDMQQIHHQIHPQVPGTGYGFESFYQNSYNGQRVIGKGGDLPGYHSWMWLMPEQKVGGFVIFNSDGPDLREKFFKAFMDHYYPGKPTTAFTPVTSQAELGQLTGIYQDLRLPFWILQVSATDDGKLKIKDPYGAHILREIAPLLFEDELGNKAGFKVNSNGTRYAFYNKMDSWAKKVPASPVYSDVGKEHPYAVWIHEAGQLGVLASDGESDFHPEQGITRAEFISGLMHLTGVAPSKNTTLTGEPEEKKYLGYVQKAIELGLVQGRGPEQSFAVTADITRQEAAVLMWRAAMIAGVNMAQSSGVKLAGDTAPWAVDAVQYIVNNGMYGPELAPNSAGALDYRSTEPLLRQEAAALLSLFCNRLSVK
ncbi:serine hydrolase [Paenibacillus riograndensis]|uniref:Protein Flp n=1 Tax=Paenibacillus riograndensis SBR5 TaxID=1073571 RepID=A0A0E4CUQ1_9BACL|nr:serine hydrolase [Paenibacillus riograndensis]CQR52578.1 protein Flp [Paenibacillus riograndensis SBR5]